VIRTVPGPAEQLALLLSGTGVNNRVSMSTPRGSGVDRSLVAFRRRINAFFGHPRAVEFAANLDPPSPRPPATAAAALGSRLDDALTRLGVPPSAERFRLRKSLIMHDGQVVAMTGDHAPLQADDDLRIVTTSTTVLDGGRLRSETTVLVFERRAGQ
jgi:hypothetical protein